MKYSPKSGKGAASVRLMNMSKIRMFVDANILILMTNPADASMFEKIKSVLYDPNREFIASDFLRLEVLPKPTFNKRQPSIAFCEKYFQNCQHYVETNKLLLDTAFAEACNLGLPPIDAIHLAAAHLGNADDFVTLEKPTKPMHRSRLVKVIYLHDVE